VGLRRVALSLADRIDAVQRPRVFGLAQDEQIVLVGGHIEDLLYLAPDQRDLLLEHLPFDCFLIRHAGLCGTVGPGPDLHQGHEFHLKIM